MTATPPEHVVLRRGLMAACDEALQRSQRGYDTAELAIAYLRRAALLLLPGEPGDPHDPKLDHVRGFACLRCACATAVDGDRGGAIGQAARRRKR